MDGDRQMAAQCVARLFEGMGHEIRKKSGSGVGYLEEGSSQLTEYEKVLLKEAFDFFLGLIKGEESKL
jgi:hypothetical protein